LRKKNSHGSKPPYKRPNLDADIQRFDSSKLGADRNKYPTSPGQAARFGVTRNTKNN
jgi:hypothetical protein